MRWSYKFTSYSPFAPHLCLAWGTNPFPTDPSFSIFRYKILLLLHKDSSQREKFWNLRECVPSFISPVSCGWMSVCASCSKFESWRDPHFFLLTAVVCSDWKEKEGKCCDSKRCSIGEMRYFKILASCLFFCVFDVTSPSTHPFLFSLSTRTCCYLTMCEILLKEKE